jgi:hypothetical protein
MTDPHIAALLYRVEHSPLLNFEQPCEHDLPKFRIRIERGEATVELKVHFATVEEAQAIVEACLRSWEADVALKNDDPGVLRFHYLRPEIVDPNPTPGVAHLRGFLITINRGKLLPYVGIGAPPAGMAMGPEAAEMFDKWRRYKAGKAELADTANFCRTALKGKMKFGISEGMLRRLGQLAARERKYGEVDGRPLTEIERAWLEAVLRKLIRRAAEVEGEPNATRALITVDDPDLPKLPR